MDASTEGEASLSYRAFISYSHRDDGWARWLHRSLEAYRVPQALIGRPSADGPVPARLLPVFRDRDELASSADLSESLRHALQRSRNLLVLCSPAAAGSRWVNEEIREFHRLGRSARIFALIVSGEPHAEDPTLECFPPALRCTTAAAGVASDRLTEPLAADVRAGAGSREEAKLKLIAGLLGVGYDELRQRETIAARRRRIRVQALAATILLLATAAVGGGLLWSWTAADAQALVGQAVKGAATEIGRAVQLADRAGVSRILTEGTLRTIEVGLDGVLQVTSGAIWLPWRRPEAMRPLLTSRAELLMVFADHYGVIGSSDRQLTAAREAHRLLVNLAARDPGDSTAQRRLAMSYDLLGHVLAARWETGDALNAFRSALTIREATAQAAPGDLGRQREIALSHARIGDMLRRHGRDGEALAEYRIGLAITSGLADAFGNDARLRRDLWTGYDRIGDMLLKQGDLPATEAAWRTALDIAAGLAAADPMDVQAQRDLAASHDKLGRVLERRGDFDAALISRRESLAISERLAAADPTNVALQRDLTLSYDGVGDAQRALGRTGDALAAYRASLTRRQALVAIDPGNALLQRDLSVTHNKIGDVLAARSEPEAALVAYRASLDIRQRLAIADPMSAQSQRDLAMVHERIGRTLEVQDLLPLATAEFAQTAQITRRLLDDEPSNPSLRRMLFDAEERRADLQQRIGSSVTAAESYCRALAAIPDEVSANPDAAGWRERRSRVRSKLTVLTGDAPPPC